MYSEHNANVENSIKCFQEAIDILSSQRHLQGLRTLASAFGAATLAFSKASSDISEITCNIACGDLVCEEIISDEKCKIISELMHEVNHLLPIIESEVH